MASGIGATVNEVTDRSRAEVFFGEDQGRYLITTSNDWMDVLQDRAKQAKVFLPWIGKTGGTHLKLGDARAISVAKLRTAHETWFPAFMAGS
jgi:phosphoribosylformylglycinamidine (FGAM) synthase-like enzyme